MQAFHAAPAEEVAAELSRAWSSSHEPGHVLPAGAASSSRDGAWLEAEKLNGAWNEARASQQAAPSQGEARLQPLQQQAGQALHGQLRGMMGNPMMATLPAEVRRRPARSLRPRLPPRLRHALTARPPPAGAAGGRGPAARAAGDGGAACGHGGGAPPPRGGAGAVGGPPRPEHLEPDAKPGERPAAHAAMAHRRHGQLPAHAAHAAAAARGGGGIAGGHSVRGVPAAGGGVGERCGGGGRECGGAGRGGAAQCDRADDRRDASQRRPALPAVAAARHAQADGRGRAASGRGRAARRGQG